jgi:hypothetical protein
VTYDVVIGSDEFGPCIAADGNERFVGIDDLAIQIGRGDDRFAWLEQAFSVGHRHIDAHRFVPGLGGVAKKMNKAFLTI